MSAVEPIAPRKTPVTMLSGFLGSGKTTLLRYVLENSKEKIACIVNDVAQVNIDAKLVRNDRNRAPRDQQVQSTSDLADTIELANGCACCNLQDELFASFEQILALASKRGEPYARIILENSGVAEPQQIRDKFNEAVASGHPVMAHVELDTMVTVVDSATFIKDYASRAPLAARPDLGDGGTMRPVVDLLVEQVEVADFVVLNKIDQLTAAEAMEQLCAIVSSLNPFAKVIPTEHGKIPIEQVLGPVQTIVAKLNIEGQHRGVIAAARKAMELEHAEAADKASAHHHHDHAHKHEHHADGAAHTGGSGHGEDHDHAHKHDHGHHHHHHQSEEEKSSCMECVHEGEHHHAHEHGHEHHHAHEHGHEHHHHHESEEDKSNCEVCKHEGDHDHHHHHHHEEVVRGETRAASRFGIRSFVYSRRAPFHPVRLRDLVLRWLPVTTNSALEGSAPGIGDSPIKTVMRSKGFMWMSNSHVTAYYWSHAGQHFEMRDEGDWWSAVPDEDWPSDPAQKAIIQSDFDASNPNIGDRRQEIVFIGVGMDEAQITAQLDSALLTDDEVTKYWERWCKVKARA